MFKKLIAAVAFVAITALATVEPEAKEIDYNKLADGLEIVQEYNTDELTTDILENRNGKIIIEKTIGKVTTKEKDGVILNTKDKYYNYISYSKVDDAEVGDIILTYFIYNPDTNYYDDILYRFDYIIDRTEGKSDLIRSFFFYGNQKNLILKNDNTIQLFLILKNDKQKIGIFKNDDTFLLFLKIRNFCHGFSKLDFYAPVAPVRRIPLFVV